MKNGWIMDQVRMKNGWIMDQVWMKNGWIIDQAYSVDDEWFCLKPLGNILSVIFERFHGILNLAHMMPRGTSLSYGCTPDRCRYSSLAGKVIDRKPWNEFSIRPKSTLSCCLIQSIKLNNCCDFGLLRLLRWVKNTKDIIRWL